MYTHIVTQQIPARSSGWMGRMVSIWFGRWWWLVALLVGVPVILGLFVDMRWLLVAMIVILLGYPTLLWWVYAQYGLTVKGRLAMCPRIVEFTPDAMTITYFAPQFSESEEDSESEQEVQPPLTEEIKIRVKLADIDDIRFGVSATTIEWGDGDPWSYVRIPHAAFTSIDESRKLMDWWMASKR